MNKKRIKALQQNKRILFFTRLFVELRALNAVMTLFYLKRGITISEVLYLSVIWSVVTLVSEIPSGYLADVIGRKQTIIIGILLNLSSVLLLFVAFDFITFVFSAVLASLGSACFTGTDSALLYDSLKELKDEKSSLRVSGKYFSSSRLAKIFIPSLGAIIAKNLLPWQLNILISIDLVGGVVSLVVSQRLTEPNRKMDVSEKESGIFKDSLKLFKKNKIVRKFAINKSLVFIGTLIAWRLYQPILRDFGVSIPMLGLIYGIFQLLTFVSSWHTDKIHAKLTSTKFLNYPVIGGLITAGVFLVTKNVWLLSISSILLMVLGTFRNPVFFEQINYRIKSFNRATTISVLNVIKGFFDVPIILLAGYLAGIDYKYSYLVISLLFAISLVFFRIDKKDIIKHR